MVSFGLAIGHWLWQGRELVETKTFGSRVIYERYAAPAMSRTDTAVCRF